MTPPSFSWPLRMRTSWVPMIDARIEIGAQDQRQAHARGAPAGLLCEQHARDQRDGVGLEEVGRHAGVVADVVADVVGDHGRVARVVLRDAGLELADEIGADVGALGEDAAAEAGEDRDQRAAEAEADERADGVLLVDATGAQDAVVAGDAEQAESDDQDAGDGAALEGDVERGRDAAPGGLGDARVGAHRHVHADVARRSGQDRADQEAEGLLPAEGARDGVGEQEQRRDHDRDDADGAVLPVQVGVRALLDRSLDLAHALVARRLLEDPGGQVQAVRDCGKAADKGDEHVVLRQEALHGLLAPESERRRHPGAPLYGSKRTGDCNTRIPQRSQPETRSCNAPWGRRPPGSNVLAVAAGRPDARTGCFRLRRRRGPGRAARRALSPALARFPDPRAPESSTNARRSCASPARSSSSSGPGACRSSTGISSASASIAARASLGSSSGTPSTMPMRAAATLTRVIPVWDSSSAAVRVRSCSCI